MTDVFVYQMGKCASTAIVEALQAAGLEAAHTHELGQAVLERRVRRLTASPVGPYVLEHGVGQLVRDIRLTSEILRRRAEGDRIRVITLARHPLDWYWSSLLQTFEARKHDVLAADTIAAFEDAWGRGAIDELSALHRIIVEAFVREIASGMQLAADALARTAGGPLRERVLQARELIGRDRRQTAGFGFKLFTPATWFGDRIEPLTGIDVLSRPLSAEGFCRITTEWCDLLLLAYERLAALEPVIGEFVGRPVRLPVVNSSQAKRYAGEVAVMRRLVQLPDTLADLLWNSPYCRHFGYGPPAAGG